MMSTTAETIEVKTVKCWKCDGKKVISTFHHYANGVCFGCNGTGTMKVKVTAEKIAAMGEDTRRKCEWMLKATVEQVEKMSWKQIRACMDFCHLYVMNAEAREIYGYSVKEAFERVARPHYARLQNERAEAFWENRIAERGW